MSERQHIETPSLREQVLEGSRSVRYCAGASGCELASAGERLGEAERLAILAALGAALPALIARPMNEEQWARTQVALRDALVAHAFALRDARRPRHTGDGR